MTQPRRATAATLTAALFALASCHLVDQRDFNANAGKKPVPQAAPVVAIAGPKPLVTIDYTMPDPDYSAELSVAVKRALAVKSNVLFSVTVLAPLAATPEAQAAALQDAAATGREIAEAIVANGADEGQVELTVRGDAGVTVREVRVFVH
jgi:hypothetical protein